MDEENIKPEKKKSRFPGLRNYFHSLYDMRDDMMSYEEIDTMMREQTVIHGANMWILMLAILIASIGLNVNSTAVIIGAMLISPLMSGIMTMGYSIAVRDIPLFLKALVRFATQVAISLLTSTIYFMISPLTEPTSEMIARTSPTLWDVLIALFGGLAGMIGHTRKKHSNVIPGVAIATALMPPLCTAGYGIATGQLRFFAGAFYLFIINTLFIAISSALVTLALKCPAHKNISKKAQRHTNIIIAVIAVLTVTPSVFVAMYTVADTAVDTNVSRYLENEFTFSDTQIVKSETDKQNNVISVSLVGATVGNDVIELLENQLPEYNLENYSLRVTQNVVTETDNSDKVTIIMQENTITELNERLDEQNEEISVLRASVDMYEGIQAEQEALTVLPEKAEKIFPRLQNCRVGVISDGSMNTVVLIAETEQELSDYDEDVIKNWLLSETDYENAGTDITYLPPEEPEEPEEMSGETERR